MGLTCCAMAHTKPASSRAIATTILLRLTPRAASRRKRAHSRTCAFQAMSSAALGAVDLATRDQRAHLRRVLIGPCRFHQCASGRAVAGFGDGALAATFTGGIFTRDRAQDSS